MKREGGGGGVGLEREQLLVERLVQNEIFTLIYFFIYFAELIAQGSLLAFLLYVLWPRCPTLPTRAPHSHSLTQPLPPCMFFNLTVSAMCVCMYICTSVSALCFLCSACGACVSLCVCLPPLSMHVCTSNPPPPPLPRPYLLGSESLSSCLCVCVGGIVSFGLYYYMCARPAAHLSQ